MIRGFFRRRFGQIFDGIGGAGQFIDFARADAKQLDIAHLATSNSRSSSGVIGSAGGFEQATAVFLGGGESWRSFNHLCETNLLRAARAGNFRPLLAIHFFQPTRYARSNETF